MPLPLRNLVMQIAVFHSFSRGRLCFQNVSIWLKRIAPGNVGPLLTRTPSVIHMCRDPQEQFRPIKKKMVSH